MPFSTRFSPKTNRIVGASFVAVVLIGGAYIFSGPSLFSSPVASAESTDQLLKAYASKDSDGDGLPDWQEALYGTDPNKAISNKFGIPDGEAVAKGLLTPKTLKDQLPKANTATPVSDIPGVDPAPGSVTEQFSQQFLQAYMAKSKGQPMSTADQQVLVTELLTSITTQSQPMFQSGYTKVAIHTSSTETNLEYADALEKIMVKDDLPDGSNDPVVVMQAVILNKDASAKPKLLAISAMYGTLTKDLLSIPVPVALVDSHLKLVQSFDSLNKSVGLVADYQKDPIGVMGALAAFTTGTSGVAKGVSDISLVILQNGEPVQGTPGYVLVRIARASQSTQ